MTKCKRYKYKVYYEGYINVDIDLEKAYGDGSYVDTNILKDMAEGKVSIIPKPRIRPVSCTKCDFVGTEDIPDGNPEDELYETLFKKKNEHAANNLHEDI